MDSGAPISFRREILIVENAEANGARLCEHISQMNSIFPVVANLPTCG
jgi:hypothetical protein